LFEKRTKKGELSLSSGVGPNKKTWKGRGRDGGRRVSDGRLCRKA